MNIKLIEGEFTSSDTLELVSQMIQTKIKYHENKIENLYNEEDIKYRESKIKSLQQQLSELRIQIKERNNHIMIDGAIHIN